MVVRPWPEDLEELLQRSASLQYVAQVAAGLLLGGRHNSLAEAQVFRPNSYGYASWGSFQDFKAYHKGGAAAGRPLISLRAAFPPVPSDPLHLVDIPAIQPGYYLTTFRVDGLGDVIAIVPFTLCAMGGPGAPAVPPEHDAAMEQDPGYKLSLDGVCSKCGKGGRLLSCSQCAVLHQYCRQALTWHLVFADMHVTRSVSICPLWLHGWNLQVRCSLHCICRLCFSYNMI